MILLNGLCLSEPVHDRCRVDATVLTRGEMARDKTEEVTRNKKGKKTVSTIPLYMTRFIIPDMVAPIDDGNRPTWEKSR